MKPPLYVAAGGGGDAIMAVVLHAARGFSERPIIATFSWDRLMFDPVPGPRSVEDFDGLAAFGPSSFAFTPQTRAWPPAGSTLPRLAGELDATFVLLDPSHGAIGLRDQIADLVHHTECERIEIVDVGGDVVAAGDEPTLRSPLADALTLAAAHGQQVAVDVSVTGAGLDGELPATVVEQRLRQCGARLTHRISADDAQAAAGVLEWHPSEATTLTLAAAQGLRGRAEVRTDGYSVDLTDTSNEVHTVGHAAAYAGNRIAQAIEGSRTLAEAEAVVREQCGRSEIDFEREKQAANQGKPVATEEALATVAQYLADARARGVVCVTFRRLAEVAGLRGDQLGILKNALTTAQPGRSRCGVWVVSEAADAEQVGRGTS